jgi:hypothetical protein
MLWKHNDSSADQVPSVGCTAPIGFCFQAIPFGAALWIYDGGLQAETTWTIMSASRRQARANDPVLCEHQE